MALAPAAASAPILCGDACVIGSDIFGYRPALVVLASGSTVAWTSSDYTHPTQDGTGAFDPDPCFFALAAPGSTSAPVRFLQQEGALYAEEQGQPAARCETATALPDGSFALPYFCIMHPTMRGTLVVTPGEVTVI